MTPETNDADARLALSSIELRRRQVIAEIDMPWWYWWGVAVGWVALGIVTNLRHPWATASATLTFGAVRSAVAQRVLSPAAIGEGNSVSARTRSARTFRRSFWAGSWAWLRSPSRLRCSCQQTALITQSRLRASSWPLPSSAADPT